MCHEMDIDLPCERIGGNLWVIGYKQMTSEDGGFRTPMRDRYLKAVPAGNGWLISDPSYERHVALISVKHQGQQLNLCEALVPAGLYAVTLMEHLYTWGAETYHVAAHPAWLSWATPEQFSASHLLIGRSEDDLADAIAYYTGARAEAWGFQWRVSYHRPAVVTPWCAEASNLDDAKWLAFQGLLEHRGFSVEEQELIKTAPVIREDHRDIWHWARLACRLW